MEARSDAMQGRICLVTGSTSGIGKATALGLAKLGATVIVVGRDRDRGSAAVAEISAASGNPNVDLLLADLSSQASVRQLARDVQSRYPNLHVLVNNAGGVYSQRSETVDGIETTFAINHLAYFLLTNLLLDLLKASAPARIVNVTSTAEARGSIDFEDLQGKRQYRAFPAYAQSKLANVMFTYELADRLAGTGVIVNCVHPGMVASGFGQNNSGWMRLGINLMRPFMKSPAQGARTPIYVASSPDVAGLSGKYFMDRKAVRSSRSSYDAAIRHRLWQISAQMTGLAEQ
jgi:NAD(P)-dependent dehydrogenase (short-subunit alcohol dehydrogenase family)